MAPRSTSASRAASSAGRDGGALDADAFRVQQAEQRAHDPVADGLGVGVGLEAALEVVGQLAFGGQHPGVVVRQAVRGDEPLAPRIRQLGQLASHPLDPAPRRSRAAAGRGRGSSGSRGPPPCSASSALRPGLRRPTGASPGRRRRRSSRIASWRSISYSIARSTKRKEFMFLSSARRPERRGCPRGRSETLASQRKLPSSMFPSQIAQVAHDRAQLPQVGPGLGRACAGPARSRSRSAARPRG